MSAQANGLHAWLLQRLSAVYMLGFLLFLLIAMPVMTPADYATWRAWFGDPWMGVATALFFAAMLLHAWVGLRDVVIDYIHPTGLRLTVLTLIALALAGCLLWVLRVLWVASL